MKSKRVKKQSKIKRNIAIIIICTIIIITLIYLYDTYQKIEINNSNYETKKVQSTINEQTVENTIENSKTVADVLENTMESVVGISKLKDNGISIFSSNNETLLGLGTGLIVTESGYILSNEHVTGSKYSTCYITLENGKKYDGKVVWSDTDLDLSITKIDAKGLKYITLGNPIGFEFRRTVTSGIISAKNRSIKLEENNNISYMSDLIQTDATINPGNSGGPLIYPNGEVIGINTVKISSAEGIGFAIPINVVKGVIESFKNTGSFEQTTIGIYAYDKDVIPYLNSNINFSEGIYIAEITKNGPAESAGLKQGDIITEIDSKKLSTMNDLREYIYTKKVGDIVNLQISRGKINRSIDVTLGKK